MRVEDAALAAKVTEFWGHVNVNDPSCCWYWEGYTEDGYGKFHFLGRMRWAPELAVTFTTGEVKGDGLDTCHSRECSSRLCCNPSHLRFDTRLSNVADMVAVRGPNRNHKLSFAQAEEIRKRIAAGAMQRELAAHYGVCESTICDIKYGRKYIAS